MPTAPETSSKTHRLARYYLQQLKAASDAFQREGETKLHGLQLFEQDWPQISYWQAWAADRTRRSAGSAEPDAEALAICSDYVLIGFPLLFSLRNPRERLQWLESALSAARQLGDRRAEAHHLSASANTYIYVSAYDDAYRCAEQALPLCKEAGRQDLCISNLTTLGYVAEMRADYRKAQAHYQEALKIAEVLGRRGAIGQCLMRLALILRSQGNHEASKTYAERSLAIQRELGNAAGIGDALFTLGMIALSLGDPHSMTYLEQSLVLVRQFGTRYTLASLLNMLGTAACAKEDYNAAFDYHRESLALEHEAGNQRGIAAGLANLAWAYFMLGDLDSALDHHQRSLDISRVLQLDYFVIESLAELALTYIRLEEEDKAVASLTEALGMVLATQNVIAKYHVVVAAAALVMQWDQPDTAAHWVQAVLPHIPREDPLRTYIETRLIPALESNLGRNLTSDAPELTPLDDLIRTIQPEVSRLIP